MGDLIKLHLTSEKPLEFEGGAVAGESLWALRISRTTAKINNVSFGTQGLALGDLVEFDADHEVVAVLERGARTRLAGYDPGPSDADANERYRAIREFLARHDVLTEGAVPGVVALSVPAGLSDRELREVRTACPVPLTLADAGDSDRT